jgi:hypothetical protein
MIGWLAALSLTLLPAVAQAQKLGHDELSKLVNGQKWLIAMYGNLSDKGTTMYWDFNRDGSVCMRLANSKPDAKCADTGHWKVEAETLCWDLKFLGEQYRYKSACVEVQKTLEHYEAINMKGGFRQFVFRPVK